MNEKSIITISGLTKRVSDENGYSYNLFSNINFDIKNDQFISILAPVGSGKTTLLKIIAGLDQQTEGEILGNDGNLVPKTVFIPGQPSSFPWLDVTENIKIANKEISDSEIKRLVELVGLEGYENHYPDNKSLGFRFRISLARALAVKPKVILIDDPFVNIDKKFKYELYKIILKIKEIENNTFILATTSIPEALFLSDQIILLGGKPVTNRELFEIKYTATRNVDLLKTNEYRVFLQNIEESIHDISSAERQNFLI